MESVNIPEGRKSETRKKKERILEKKRNTMHKMAYYDDRDDNRVS
tara:strand:- start:533 stop:667 length:135 start_codon:yes stop_codon:yes gene_type:complete